MTTIKKVCNALGIVCMILFLCGFFYAPIFFGMFVFLLAGFFLPDKSEKRHRYPSPTVREGSDEYLDHEVDGFDGEEREALLRESWMAQAEKFNRTRRL